MTTESDRELLESAARAAGMHVDGLACKAIVQMDDELALLVRNSLGGNSIWNPLRDSGDALTLACKLGITIYTGICHAYVTLDDGTEITAAEELTGDHQAATRRAIVRAAAAIGTNKEGARA